MLKVLATASLFFAFTLGMTATAVAQTMMHFSAPGSRYVLPGGVAGYPGYRRAAPFTGWRLPALSITERMNGAIRAASRKIRERATDQAPA
jgi:hypothetical protein